MLFHLTTHSMHEAFDARKQASNSWTQSHYHCIDQNDALLKRLFLYGGAIIFSTLSLFLLVSIIMYRNNVYLNLILVI